MFTAHVIISGYVQGIGYRSFVSKNADKLGITGFVHNIENGRVEALFQSQSKEKIEEMIALCKKGPYLSEVKNVDVDWVEGMEEFKIFDVTQ